MNFSASKMFLVSSYFFINFRLVVLIKFVLIEKKSVGPRLGVKLDRARLFGDLKGSSLKHLW